MPTLWEAVVRRLGAEAVGPYGGHAVPGGSGITVHGDLGNVSAFRSDLLLRCPGRNGTPSTLLPVDAKYKRYERHGVSAADVHQLLARRTLQVRGLHGMLGVIHVLGIGTCVTPAQATAWVGSVLR
ncbi:hypothetical protein ACIPPM_04870 [Streptomyces sp. NPDC090119]|uniref:hypothetical protein n=1 Tax=Streptomyces sp. NPDC090119 TaxID=3365951 RepID=UPI00381478B9